MYTIQVMRDNVKSAVNKWESLSNTFETLSEAEKAAKREENRDPSIALWRIIIFNDPNMCVRSNIFD